MKLDNKQLFEIVGVLTVVVSLLFVGMQLMLDRNVAVGEQYQLRAQTALENARSEFSNDAYIQSQVARWEKGNMPGWWTSELESEWNGRVASELTFVDLYRVTRRIQMSYLQIDNVHYQFEKGLLENENWPPYRDELQNMLQSPLDRAIILSHSTMRPAMRELVLELIQENESEL